MDVSAPVTTLPGVGQSIAKKLAKLDIRTIYNLLYHLPFRYEDRSLISPVSQIQPGETVTVIASLDTLKNEYTHRGRFIQKGIISDDSGSIDVTWFNQSYLTKILASGQKIALHGKADIFKNKKSLISPEYETINSNFKFQISNLTHMARLVPVYPETAGITSKYLRTKIHYLLSVIPDEIYPSDLLNWSQALKNIHFPSHLSVITPARERLAFDELLLLQLTSIQRRASWEKTRLTHPFSIPYPQIRRFISSLPFTLTPSQHRSVDEILTDLSTPKPMNRLLEGDVGSGKTVVAAIAAHAAHLSGFQTLILAPTQILAQQHHQTLSALFQPFGTEIGLITGKSKIGIKNSEIGIIVGTHALLTKQFDAKNVGLIVIDEQHRFGVAQRALASALGESPHILTMTATPIPRTIALTLHADLDLSVLSDLPEGRIPIKTWVVPEEKRAAAYKWIAAQMKNEKSQCFIVCPFISESESLSSVKAATTEFEKLKKIFSPLKLGLLHGKLKALDRDLVINKFRAGEYQILVSTPVVEVGIDIPSATVMVIESAERYGLAQLHQLRGRVGRTNQQSYCLLFSPPTPRIKFMESLQSGLELAEIDLKLRGPGQIFGHAQSGQTSFKAASYADFHLIKKTKSLAEIILPTLDKYPILRQLTKTDKIELVQPN